MATKKVTVALEGRETVSDAARRAGDSVDNLGSKGRTAAEAWALGMVGVNQALELAQKAMEAFRRAFEFAELGAETRQVTQAFESLATQANVSANEIIRSLQRASANTIAEFDILQSANRALLFGLPIDELTELMAIARASATATGQSVQQMFDDIVTGIARGSPMILDNLGLTIKIGEVTESYATQLGKTATELTAVERQHAILNGVLESGAELMERVGDAASELTDLERIQQLTSAWEDFQRNLAQGFQEWMRPTIDMARELLDLLNEGFENRRGAQAVEHALSAFFDPAKDQQLIERALEYQRAQVAEAQRLIEESTARINDLNDRQNSRSFGGFFESQRDAREREAAAAEAAELRRLRTELLNELVAREDVLNELMRRASLIPEPAPAPTTDESTGTGEGVEAEEEIAQIAVRAFGPFEQSLDSASLQFQALDTTLALIAQSGTHVLQTFEQELVPGITIATQALATFPEKADQAWTAPSLEELFPGLSNNLRDAIETHGSDFAREFFAYATDAVALYIDEEVTKGITGSSKTKRSAGGGARKGPYGDVTITDQAFGVEGINMLIDGFGGVLSTVFELAQEFEAFAAILDPVSILMDGLVATLGPMVDQILTPVIGAIRIMGETIGTMLMPALSTLIPFIEAWAKAWVWMYNTIFVPVYNALRTLWNGIYNGFATVINWVIDLINWAFGWLGVNISRVGTRSSDFGHLSPINVGDLYGAGAEYGGSTSDNTTVRRAPDIHVHINVEGNVIGAGGLAEVGELTADALIAYAGIGGRIILEDATTGERATMIPTT